MLTGNHVVLYQLFERERNFKASLTTTQCKVTEPERCLPQLKCPICFFWVLFHYIMCVISRMIRLYVFSSFISWNLLYVFSQTDLAHHHPYTIALRNFGNKPPTDKENGNGLWFVVHCWNDIPLLCSEVFFLNASNPF